VAGELSGIESNARGMDFDDERHRLIRHSPRPNLPRLVDWPEYRPPRSGLEGAGGGVRGSLDPRDRESSRLWRNCVLSLKAKDTAAALAP
jgi:hypothetical protein